MSTAISTKNSRSAQFPTTFDEMLASAKSNWGWIVAGGAASIVAGGLALTYPVAGSFAVQLFLAGLLIITGTIHLVALFHVGKGQRLVHGLAGTLQVALGMAIMVWPVAGILSLTVLVAAALLGDGCMRICLAIALKPAKWGWLLASGIATTAVAILIVTSLPNAALWTLGVLVGVNLIFSGASDVAYGLAAKRLSLAENGSN